MSGFLLAEEGPLVGLIIRFEDGEQWVIGRDPDVSFQVLEDPMVSRRHVICSLSDEGYLVENLSSVNPATINGNPIAEPTVLHEGDTLQIGNTFFRFTEDDPSSHTAIAASEEEGEEMTLPQSPTFYEEEAMQPLAFSSQHDARWILKVIAGPNSGAEFPLEYGKTYILGKDPSTCDIIFQDLSVSREHCKISLSEDNVVSLEDLNSRNSVLVNGALTRETKSLHSQDLISLGTTSFLVIDREQMQDTIYSPPEITHPEVVEPEGALPSPDVEKKAALKSLRETIVPFKHLAIGLLFVILLFIGVGGIISLFKSQSVTVAKRDESADIRETIKNFPSVEFSWNHNNGKVFLLGHVLTEIDHQELVYLLRTLPFVGEIEDNVVIDEFVWDNMNALFIKNPNWRGVSMTAAKPGLYILRGYLQKQEDLGQLMDFIHLNFPYADHLENQVAVEQTLQTQIQSLLLDKGFVNVTFQLTNGELILAGRVNAKSESHFMEALETIKMIKGIKMIKNFVIFTTASTARIDITDKYKVSGSSKFGNVNEFVVINGKILSQGDSLDGMRITDIKPHTILLEKDGLKYKIDYNQQ